MPRNAALLTARTARADKVYSGVLYEALDVASLDAAARRRATRWLAVTSSVFGLVRPGDPIPAYRLAGDVTLPGLGGVAAHWRTHLDPVVREAPGSGLLVDLRSSTYAAFWRPPADLARRVATVRVLHEVGRPAAGGQPLQQGDQGPTGARAARGAVRRRARRRASPTTSARSAGRSRR